MRELVLPRPFKAQRDFLLARTRYIAYGGSRGGGKSFAVRMKALLLALYYPGIRILVIRRTYPEVYENHIRDMTRLSSGLAVYRDSDKSLGFVCGSRIKFGYCACDADLSQYQGVEYDVVFIDEATQFTEHQFRFISASVRGVNRFPKRIYLTCNPGGPGHGWVKRLFIDRLYTASEDPSDYTFIRAGVRDNTPLLQNDTAYLSALENLPEDLRRAWLDGDWDVFGGQYYPEFRRGVHTVEPFPIPDGWQRYRAFDYGLDMLAVLWAACDEGGDIWVYRELCRPGLIVSEAARRICELSEGERIIRTAAPPDMWNRQKDTGKSMAELFFSGGIPLCRANNDRVQGWMQIKELLAPGEHEKPRLHIFSSCTELVRCLPELLRDERDPCDAATYPHEITHICDALRYLAMERTRRAVTPTAESWEDEHRRKIIGRLKRAQRRVLP